MNLKKELIPSDFVIEADGESKNVRVIEIVEAKAYNYQRIIEMPVLNNQIKSDTENDIIKVAVVERHNATGSIGKGFVKGFGFKSGAVASTVSHDAHNLTIIGTNDEDMAIAGNALCKCGGGISPFMTSALLALAVIPELRLTNRGYIDCTTFKSVSIFANFSK